MSKIGYSSEHPSQRIFGIQTGNPCPLRLVDWFPGTRASEGIIHRALDRYHKAREWFSEPQLLEVVFAVIKLASVNDDDELVALPAQELESALADGIEEALHGAT